MRSTFIYYLLGFLLIVGLLLLIGPRFSQSKPAGLVDEIVGPAEIKTEAKAPWQPLKLGEAVNPGATLKAGPGGAIGLRWPGGTRIRLGENAGITLTGSDSDNDSKQFNLKVEQQSGGIWVRLRKDSTILARVTIATPVAVFSAGHSTLFSSELLPGGNNRLGVPEGKVEITQGPAKSVVTGPKVAVFDRKGAVETARAMTESELTAWRKTTQIAGAFITLNEPKEGARLTNSLLSLSGYTDPGNTIDISAENQGKANQTTGVVDNRGTWRAKIALTRGESVLKIMALDEEGRQTLLQRKVSY
jgi:hypothetical protein